MIILLSPAKSLDWTPGARGLPMTTPELMDQTAELSKTTRRLKRSDLKRLMSISDVLADLNFHRFQAFDPESEDGLQAAIAFDGDVYAGFDARSLDKKAMLFAQEHVRILSGLYGVLRPLDAIQPYRLEMGTRLKTRRGPSLYAFWGDRIAGALNRAAVGQKDPTLVNCASQEYFGGVEERALEVPLVHCHFREEKDGAERVISFYAKKARGLMARYAIEKRVQKAVELKGFDLEGYRFRPDASTDTDWVFSRPQPPLKS